MTTKKPTDKAFNFEKSVDQLNVIVEKMEHGDLSLEQSLKQFEQGIKLIKDCQKALQDAEQKVEILTKDQAEPFHADD